MEGKRGQQDQGFTIIELMIVVAILGILFVIGFPVFSEGQVGARRNSCLERQRIIYEAALLYGAQNVVPDGDVSAAVLQPDYIKTGAADCPTELDGDYDDYTIVFEASGPKDVICNVMGDEHPWSPH